MKEQFNPEDWLKKTPVNSDQYSVNSGDHSTISSPHPIVPSDISSEVDTVITRIEAAFTDITTSYADWLNVGFAFAHEFGEAGRSFFQRVSRFYSGFTLEECNKQYDQCLKSQGHGITIKTFFHMAKQAGIDVSGQGASEGSSDGTYGHDISCPYLLPTLPGFIFPTLPAFLQRVVERASSREERDLLLLGSLTTLSACLYKVFGIYDDKKVFPNLYLYVTAKASAGKGRLVLCKKLVQPIHWSLREQARAAHQLYEVEMREFNLVKNKDLSAEKPQKPPEKLLFIPANSSSTGMFQLLWDNNGRGLIFETEGDTLAQAFKTDYGNYSDGFRKAYHHETITYYRRTDREYVEILFPCVSCVLSGTPKQVAILIPNAENGLFSRFMFYHMNLNPVWKNVFLRQNERPLDEHFHELGKEFYALYTSLAEGDNLEFRLTPDQQEQFNSFFTQIHEKYLLLQGIDYLATIRRLGLNAFRICMILSALRLMETGDLSDTIYCRDEDFRSALAITRILVRHASHVYSELPEEAKAEKPKNKQEIFLEKLPNTFSHKEFVDIAKELGINGRTADRYIHAFCHKELIRKDLHGMYSNLTISDGNKIRPPKAEEIDKLTN